MNKTIGDFTGLYSLSKTLRFELKPEVETKKRFDNWIKEVESNNESTAENLIARDYKIFNAYKTLKPILDSIHEQYITIALQSSVAKKIDFTCFLPEYSGKTKKLSKIEEKLRKEIGETFKVSEEFFFEEIKAVEPKAKSKSKDSILTDQYVLTYIAKNFDSFTSPSLSEDELKQHLEAFKGFFTYFSGYNINRANYYDCSSEKNTAIATRIVNDNLPIFCDNKIRFEKNKKRYLEAYQILKNAEIETKIKTDEDSFSEAKPISKDIFEMSYYNNCLSQSEIETYNKMIGNANLIINLYNQHAGASDNNFKRLPVFEQLHKQIGCGKKKSLFFSLKKDKESELSLEERQSEEILSVEKLLNVTAEAGNAIFNGSKESNAYSINFFTGFLLEQTDWHGIYWSDTATAYISGRYLLNWHELKDQLKNYSSCASFDKKREEQVKLNEAVELAGLFEVIDKENVENIFKTSVLEKYSDVIKTDEPVSKNLIKIICADLKCALDYFNANSKKILSMDSYKTKSAYTDEDDASVMQIKNWYDSIKEILRIVGLFKVKKNKMKGSLSIPEFENCVDAILSPEGIYWNKWYDGIRNYLTKKPQDDVKENMLKLNFGSSSLLGGWSDGQEKVKISTILKYENSIFLCILKNKTFFDTEKKENPVYKGEGGFRLILRNLKFQTLAGKGFVSAYKQGYSEMGKENPQKAMECLISFIKENYVKKYPALIKIVENKYTSKKEFDTDIQTVIKECYECNFVPIDWNVVQTAEKKGDIFLFKISSKDFKEKSSGKKDLQTIYWESVLSENSPHQLCAGAEIFMRKPIQAKSPVVHKAGDILINKKFSDNKTVPDDLYVKLLSFVKSIKTALHDEKEVSELLLKSDLASIYPKEYLSKVKFKIAKHDIEKDRRFYGETKYFFHCPIKLNYNQKSYSKPEYAIKEMNDLINEGLSKQEAVHFIGLDRGEKHLVYLCELDENCNIIECRSLNVINGTDYMLKLQEKSDNRQKSRQNWQKIDNISNLKDGYTSHVVHTVTEKAVRTPSYIVLEDLSRQMMQGRQKIEKSLYQKFEVALAKKLNFIVEKDIPQGEPGSVSLPLQLTPPLNTFKDIENKKQFGIMMYTRANYTSVTDPVTGWRKTIYIKNGSEEDIKNQILEKFSDFGFDGKDYYFEYKDANAEYTWRLYSGKDGEPLPRFQNKKQLQNDKNIWAPEKIDVVEILDKLFNGFNKEKSFKEQIINGINLKKIDGRSETAWQSLLYAINIIQQIRNSGISEKDNNFLYSPVRNNNGIHFDTRIHDNKTLPADADANGAYNIARKGIIMYSHIQQWKKDGALEKDLDLLVSDEEWDLWLLNKKAWKEKLTYFASKSKKQKKQ